MSARLTWVNPPGVPRSVRVYPDAPAPAPCPGCRRDLWIGYGADNAWCWGCWRKSETGKAKGKGK